MLIIIILPGPGMEARRRGRGGRGGKGNILHPPAMYVYVYK